MQIFRYVAKIHVKNFSWRECEPVSTLGLLDLVRLSCTEGTSGLLNSACSEVAISKWQQCGAFKL